MKKAYNLTNNHHKDGQEKSKKIYRLISDNVKRLDDARGCANKISDLFTPQMIILRTKLKEYCERIIFTDPLVYGVKAEELLWRKVFYDVISTSKRLKTQEYTSAEKYDLTAHINGGVGYYHHYISKLENEFDLDLDETIDFCIKNESRSSDNTDLLEWANTSVHRSLVYLGDLNRYKFELYPFSEPHKAIRYYMQALCLKPDNGMPHNQMGTLASCVNQNLSAAYHYMQCMMCKHTFEGAENNLHKLFEKNAQYLEQSSVQNSGSETIAAKPSERIKIFLGNFLIMADVWFFNKKNSNIYELCHSINMDLQECLSFSRPIASESSGSQNEEFEKVELHPSPTYLSSDEINKLIIICLLCITKLQDNNSNQLTNAIAFTLSLYSHLIQHVFNHIQEGVLNFPLTEGTNGKSKKKKHERRRRVKVNCSDEEEESEVDLSSSDSDTYSDDGPDGLICSGSSSDEDVIIESTDDNKEVEKESKDSQSNEEILKKTALLNSKDLMDIISDEDYLPCLKILSDWLASDPEILRSCGKTTKSLLIQLSNLLNLLIISLRKLRQSDLGFVHPNLLISDVAKMPLPEDYLLKNLEAVKVPQKQLDWGYFKNNYTIPNKDLVAIRMSKLVAFGKYMEGFPETGVSYDRKHRQFHVLLLEEDLDVQKMSNNDVEVEQKGKSKGQLMKNMGQLWLAAEVKDLETRTKGKMSLSPYLVVDVDSLINYMFMVKSLIYSRKFIVLVPSAVLSALDDLKKEKPEAREAIRWLEAQFNRGNRFFRAQRAQERLPLPFIKYPKKKDKESFIYVQIIECCHYLAEQQKRTTNIVTLLMGDPNALLSTENREISYVGLAQSAGVNLELITEFYAKWKKPGKGKR